jgi:hypothetical protein
MGVTPYRTIPHSECCASLLMSSMNYRRVVQIEDDLHVADCRRPRAPASNIKSCARITPAFLAAFLLTGSLAAEAQDILSTYPASSDSVSFNIGTDSASDYEGAAIGFSPEQYCTLTSATVELSGYNGVYGQLASLSIYSDLSEPDNTTMPDQPGIMLASGTVAPNDGSEASFTVEFPGGVSLAADTIYWLFVQDTSPNGWQAPNNFNWITGGDPTGAANYDGAEAFVVSGFYPDTDPPAFSIDATPTDAPEPSEYELIGMAALAGLMVSCRRARFTGRIQKLSQSSP